MSGNVWAPKDPADDLDYKFDFAGETNGVAHADSDWLAAGETIASFIITVPAGITEGSGAKATALSDANTSVTIWLSGGTAGTDYDIACKITTSASRTIERTHTLSVVSQ